MTSQAAVMIVLAAMQMLITALGTVIWARDKERRQDLRELQQEHKKLLETLPQRYVLRDDYVRTMASVDNKLDQVIGSLRDMAKHLHDHIAREAA